MNSPESKETKQKIDPKKLLAIPNKRNQLIAKVNKYLFIIISLLVAIITGFYINLLTTQYSKIQLGIEEPPEIQQRLDTKPGDVDENRAWKAGVDVETIQIDILWMAIKSMEYWNFFVLLLILFYVYLFSRDSVKDVRFEIKDKIEWLCSIVALHQKELANNHVIRCFVMIYDPKNNKIGSVCGYKDSHKPVYGEMHDLEGLAAGECWKKDKFIRKNLAPEDYKDGVNTELKSVACEPINNALDTGKDPYGVLVVDSFTTLEKSKLDNHSIESIMRIVSEFIAKELTKKI